LRRTALYGFYHIIPELRVLIKAARVFLFFAAPLSALSTPRRRARLDNKALER
jgi:hypothetical protein